MAKGITISASQKPWCTAGRTSSRLRAPLSWETMGVSAMMMPCVSRMIGSQKLEATDTAARSTALTCPAITVSTKLMAI
ncbi:hypothetical protein D3C76_1794060 [compost metagenome]